MESGSASFKDHVKLPGFILGLLYMGLTWGMCAMGVRLLCKGFQRAVWCDEVFLNEHTKQL